MEKGRMCPPNMDTVSAAGARGSVTSHTQPHVRRALDKLTFFALKHVNRALYEFDMIRDGDRVAVAVSGGKDSCALLHLLLARQATVAERYQLVALHVQMDPAGLPNLRPVLEPWFVQLGVEYAFVPLELEAHDTLPLNCQRCAWNRRKALFLQAHALGCNKLAFAHHADDAAETTLLNLLFSGRLQALSPRLDFFDHTISLIRPLIYLEESRLTRLARALQLPYSDLPCPNADTSRRAWIRRWLADAGRNRRQIRANLWRAAWRSSYPSLE
ncbi:MAG: ATP-binding protein [Anaerolineae bacterium]